MSDTRPGGDHHHVLCSRSDRPNYQIRSAEIAATWGTNSRRAGHGQRFQASGVRHPRPPARSRVRLRVGPHRDLGPGPRTAGRRHPGRSPHRSVGVRRERTRGLRRTHVARREQPVSGERSVARRPRLGGWRGVDVPGREERRRTRRDVRTERPRARDVRSEWTRRCLRTARSGREWGVGAARRPRRRRHRPAHRRCRPARTPVHRRNPPTPRRALRARPQARGVRRRPRRRQAPRAQRRALRWCRPRHHPVRSPRRPAVRPRLRPPAPRRRPGTSRLLAPPRPRRRGPQAAGAHRRRRPATRRGRRPVVRPRLRPLRPRQGSRPVLHGRCRPPSRRCQDTAPARPRPQAPRPSAPPSPRPQTRAPRPQARPSHRDRAGRRRRRRCPPRRRRLRHSRRRSLRRSRAPRHP